jgi:cyclophilin family peptidyl-prolyl cis-trans isomerase
VKHNLIITLALGLLGASSAAGEEKSPVVTIETSKGTIKVELNAEKAPITVKNFLGYVDEKFYDGLIFHRVMPRFMIQGGGFAPGMQEKGAKDPIKNEAGNGLANERGTIAMARTNVPDSATAQFYINLVDNAPLDRKNDPRGVGYCVFGKVVDGMDVVDKIATVQTGRRGMHGDVPTEDVVIKTIRRAE